MGELETRIRELAVERAEGERTISFLPFAATGKLADEFGMSTRDVNIFALEHGCVPARYVKNIGTVGIEGQARLLKATAAVVGTGGIGGNASELLARMGVGTVLLIDPDVFEETNLNRQKFATEETLGLKKVDVTGDALAVINCDVEVVRHCVAACDENLAELLDGAEVVVDALDNLDDRLILQAACRELGVVMIHGAIAGTFLQLMTIYPGDAGLCYPLPGEAREQKARGVETETGNPATTPALAAAAQVQEAIKVILGRGKTLRGKMLYMDVDDWSVELIDVRGENG